MTTTLLIFIGLLVVLLIALGFRAWKLNEELDTVEVKTNALATHNQQLQSTVAALEAEKTKMLGWLEHTEGDLDYYKTEIESRLKRERKIYKILTLGLKATGKSSLTLKWANPRVDLNTIEGTKIERYERTVSRVRVRDALVEHVFEIHDWGGEHIVDAQQELIIEEVHGILMVVDLGGKDAQQVDMERVSEQLAEFNPRTIKFFFSPKTVASCKTVVLFINKSDLVQGSPAHAEEHAKAVYAPLIETLQRYATQTHVKVLVGSASYGHSTHLLFSHFVEHILPQSAYDNELQQQKKPEMRQPPPPPAEHPRGPESQRAVQVRPPKPPMPKSTFQLPASNNAAAATAPLLHCQPARGRGKQ